MDIELMQFTIQKFLAEHRGYNNFRSVEESPDFTCLSCTSASRGTRESRRVRVNICKGQVGKKAVGELIQYSPPTECDHFILFCHKASRQGVGLLQAYEYSEVLSFEDVNVPRMQHQYVPEYRLLEEKEIADVSQRYGRPATFPQIKARLDVIARIKDFRLGDVLEARIRCPFRGNLVEYRYVT